MRSKLRPEVVCGNGVALPDSTALYLIYDAVAKRRTLIRGKLDDDAGHHCALGWFWNDNPELTMSWALLDEVAAVNDSVPATATPQKRWKKVTGWLRWKIKVLAAERTK